MQASEHSSETGALLNASASKLFASLGDRGVGEASLGGWTDSDWGKVYDAGFPLALVSESAGGFGIGSSEALGLLRTAGFHAVSLPLGETMLANRLLTDAGFPPTEGPATMASGTAAQNFSLEKRASGWHISGQAAGVPWARHAGTIALLAGHEQESYVVRLTRKLTRVEHNASLAGLPSDFIEVDADLADDDVRRAPAKWTPESLMAACAALRVLEIAGALERVLELTVVYANERIQFGKPIGKQQAVQQQLAVLAGQVAACGAAADIASTAFESLDVAALAASKVRAGEAASIAAPIAHQVHGAIGFTEEHRLRLFTRRLWAWRDEFGSERYWSSLLGEQVISRGGDMLWPFIVSLGSPGEA